MMLQHWPTDVTGWVGLAFGPEGTAQLSQKPRQAFVVMWNSTQSGMVIFLVWPVEEYQLLQLKKADRVVLHCMPCQHLI